MLDEFLKSESSLRSALYKIGRVLGIFPENSFEQYKYLFDEESENEIQKMLSLMLSSLTHCGALMSTGPDKVKWNSNFKVESYLQMLEQKKEARARQSQDRAKVKNLLRKFVNKGKVISSGGLVLEVADVDMNALDIHTIVKQNVGWGHVFKVGFRAVWQFNSTVGDMTVFEAQSPLETSSGAQSLLYLHNDGGLSAERDS